MPQPVNFICVKCDFKGSCFSTWGKHSYSVNNALIDINRGIAVCYSCDSIVSAEILPSEERIQSLKNVTGYLSQKFYEEEVERLEALRGRKSSARCLACGSHDFELIPIVEPNREQRRSGLPIRTGLFHRNCGGRIYAEFRAPNFFMGDSIPERVFDIEGYFIKVLKNSP